MKVVLHIESHSTGRALEPFPSARSRYLQEKRAHLYRIL
jgi:hypothetical protein